MKIEDVRNLAFAMPMTHATVRDGLERPNYLSHVDGSVRVLELIDYRLEDVVVKGAWSGPATLELEPHALAPVTALPVREIISATQIIADLTLGLGRCLRLSH
jgi:acetoacetate decarboxylase